MKKILLITAMCFAMIFSLTACGSDYKVTLSDYKNVTISQADIDAEIQNIRASLAEDSTSVTEGIVASGDTVDISYVGTLDGVAFEGGTADNQELTIGSETYIEGFEEGILGKEIGSTFDLPVTFPEDYSSTELAGKDAIFKITINAVKILILPEYTDEWVASISEEVLGEVVTTVEAFEKSISSFLILDKVFTESTLDGYNEDNFNSMVADQTAYYESQALQNGMDLETLYSLYGMSEEQIKADVLDNLKWQAIIFEIASLENINADDEYEAALLAEAEAASYDNTDDFIEGEKVADYNLESAKAFYLYPKVVDLLVSTATITD